MTYFVILSILLIWFHTHRSVKKPPMVRKSLMIRHVIVVLAVAIFSSADTDRLTFMLAHPQLTVSDWYVAVGFASAWLAFAVQVAVSVLGVTLWFVSFALARRNARARLLFLYLWPAYSLVGFIQYAMGIKAHGNLDPITVSVFLIMFGVPASIVFWHIKCSGEIGLFLRREPPNIALEPTPTAP
jgi:type IV secretory pathway TrbD component